MVLKLVNNKKVTTYAQYITRVDKTNIDYNNKGHRKRDSHMEITLNKMYTRGYDK